MSACCKLIFDRNCFAAGTWAAGVGWEYRQSEVNLTPARFHAEPTSVRREIQMLLPCDKAFQLMCCERLCLPGAHLTQWQGRPDVGVPQKADSVSGSGVALDHRGGGDLILPLELRNAVQGALQLEGLWQDGM